MESLYYSMLLEIVIKERTRHAVFLSTCARARGRRDDLDSNAALDYCTFGYLFRRFVIIVPVFL